MLRKLTATDDTFVYINPDHIIAMTPGGKSDHRVFSTIHLTGLAAEGTFYHVWGDDTEVMKSLYPKP